MSGAASGGEAGGGWVSGVAVAGPGRAARGRGGGGGGVTAAAIHRPVFTERRRGSATWPRAGGSTLRARGLPREVPGGAGGGTGRRPGEGGQPRLGRSPKVSALPGNSEISTVETNDPFRATGIRAAARRVPGSPEESLPSPSVTFRNTLR